MQIDDLQAELRARTPWEAVDLGFALARRFLRPLTASWLALVVPVQVLLFLVLWGHPWLAAALCWWLLPAWERVALFVVSRCLFGVQPSVRDTARGLRACFWSGLVGDLTLRRLGGRRTIVLPVSQLERLAGARARRRRRVLAAEVLRVGYGVAFGSLLAELSILSGGVVLVSWCLPDSPAFSMEVLGSQLVAGDWWTGSAIAATVILVQALVQPLRVGALFGVYIQRRTVLEGWDVELGFRRLAERLARRGKGLAAVGLALLLALPVLGGAARAQPAEGVSDARIQDATAQVLAREEFGGTHVVTRWKPRFELPESRDRDKGDGAAVLAQPLAAGAGLVLAVVVGIALVGLLLSIVVRTPALPGRGQPAPELTPAARSGLLALDGSVLPEHPAEAAWALWQAGRQAEGLGLLYRAAVAHLVHHRQLEVDDSNTEGDCLRIARRSLPARPAAYLVRLTRSWQRLAYAHRSVDDAEMRALVDGWSELDAGAT